MHPNSNNTMNEKLYLPIAIIIGAVIVAGTIFYTKNTTQPTTGSTNGTTTENGTDENNYNIITGQDHIRGNIEAPVTIIEYSDFECPFCGRFHQTMQQILADYPDNVRWAYKHFPLDQLHAQARPAAEASECIWEQKGSDGFWQFADSLFENQSRLGEELYKELAGNLGLNMDQFNDCVSSRKYKDKVEADYQDGIKAGVRGTPGNFVNGQSIPGAVPYSTLKEAVDQALADLE